VQIRILDAAERDLEEGYRFYEKQSPGVGSYFLDSLYSDIDSLACFEGIHRTVFGIIDFSPSAFHSPFIIRSLTRESWSWPYSIVAAIQVG